MFPLSLVPRPSLLYPSFRYRGGSGHGLVLGKLMHSPVLQSMEGVNYKATGCQYGFDLVFKVSLYSVFVQKACL